MSAPEPEPAPSFTRTYKRADGHDINGDYGWVTTSDFLDDEDYPTEVIEEVWERTAVRQFWHLPSAWGSCEFETGDNEDCGEDAVAWRQDGDKWLLVCAEHKVVES